MLIGVDRDDIKSADTVCELLPLCEEYSSRTDQFSLLVNINRQAGARKTVVRAVAHLDEYEAVFILHNQVDFAEAGSKILADQVQAMTTKKLKRELLGVGAYRSRVASSHDSSSAASGNNNSGSSLMSWIGPPAGSISGKAIGSPP